MNKTINIGTTDFGNISRLTPVPTPLPSPSPTPIPDQSLFVAENVPNGTVIGYLIGVPISPDFSIADFSIEDLDSDSDGIQSISFNSVTSALTVTDTDELDYEALSFNPIDFDFESFYVQVFVQDVVNESVNGTAGNDILATRNAGNTIIRGFGGNDTLMGSEGDDTLIGGKGKDILTGGKGDDTFIIGDGKKYSKAQKVDRITDFDDDDSLVFDRTTFSRKLTFDSINDNSYLPSDIEKSDRSSKTLVYDQSIGKMYFNENGSLKGFGKGGLIAQFSDTSALAGNVSINASNCRMGSSAINSAIK